MIAKRSEITLFQSIFYRDSYYKVLRCLLVEAVIILCLIAAILYYIFFSASHTLLYYDHQRPNNVIA